MYRHLYNAFEMWFGPYDRQGAVWFYSDPHFGDDEMKYLRQNYIGDEEQVKRINSKVGRYDTLVILGDIGDVSFVDRLKGYKILIMGNHDKGASNYVGHFNEIYEGPLMISDKIMLSHEPIDLPFIYNIHGHDHSGWHEADNNHKNVCAEWVDYYPVSLNSIVDSGSLKNIENIHRFTIDSRVFEKINNE